MTQKRRLAESLDTPGARIRFLRVEVKGWSQETFASKVHVTQPAVSQWERDEVIPTKQSQFLIAEALGTTRAFLFGEPIAPTAPPVPVAVVSSEAQPA